MNVIEFLRARYSEIEAAAKAATPGPWEVTRDEETDEIMIDGVDDAEVGPGWIGMPQHEPRFGCRICHVVSRQMYDGGFCDTLLALAAPFRTHPDFDPAWSIE